jgi:Helix-turn-helix domain
MNDQVKYTIKEAAKLLGCCERSVHNRCAEGKLHKRYENRKPYILHSDIMNYINTLPRVPTASAVPTPSARKRKAKPPTLPLVTRKPQSKADHDPTVTDALLRGSDSTRALLEFARRADALIRDRPPKFDRRVH